jgi:hypothetical protein
VTLKAPAKEDRFSQAEPVPRADITCFSSKSRQRLRMTLARVDQRRGGKAAFCAMTYPNEFSLDAAIFKGHLDVFGKRFLRAYPDAGFFWKLEFQKRGAPHFHVIAFGLHLQEKTRALCRFREWLAETWFEVVNSGDSKHLAAGTSAELMRSSVAILRYCAGYVSKSDQTLVGFKVGRYWGIVGRSRIPFGNAQSVALSPAEHRLIRRTMVRSMKAANRVRRIKHLAEHGYRNEATDDFLSGRARHMRKRSPQLKCFQRLPGKLRFRNNDTVNLFCDANRWAGYCESLVDLCGDAPRESVLAERPGSSRADTERPSLLDEIRKVFPHCVELTAPATLENRT